LITTGREVKIAEPPCSNAAWIGLLDTPAAAAAAGLPGPQDLGREGGADDARKELEDATEASGEVLPPPPLLYLLNYLL